MKEYQDVRSKVSFLELCKTPELAAEVTLQPIKAFDLDAAIIFADILPPLIGMGLMLEFPKVGISEAYKWTTKNKKLYIPFVEISGIGDSIAESIAPRPSYAATTS